ncbi:ATPase, T2SS/T4P/T4SS family [Chondromyces apiculatus]|uniref:Type II/IV secretion system ATP hydrolase TadA/VirB11/CpaF, TadA subfamily n=1 Tax=Chondromyces apiculatus DSM 436 TaxID=1192034 RepID=A0A017T3P5_9BACT|nr:ATPase, T2SS/T4P/T4SS family [Chondromyces apiculatus]EYF03176.1 Type II/IV secretion system ATP hydrolase TadA/VirB11/CpaF, TadA subfamily [Chondromyces apiculatus DSM 436]
MFSVIISEKGGAERREVFDRTEINVGRVQGNELMLPKGNVSKRHARLLYRDGRFIITDLKSTNGTYVNGRKIAQATIVREGDKIYIGDFVLRVEAVSAEAAVIPSEGLVAPLPTHQEPPEADAHAGALASDPPERGYTPAATVGIPALIGFDRASSPAAEPADRRPPAPAPVQVGTDPPFVPVPPSSAERGLALPSPQIEQRSEPSRSGGQVISHFPLENDPDESIEPFPGPPRVPSPRQSGSGNASPDTPIPGPLRAAQVPSLQPPSRVTPNFLGADRATPREPLTTSSVPVLSSTGSYPAASPIPTGTGSYPAAAPIPTGTGSYPAASPRRAVVPPASDRGLIPEPAASASRQQALTRLMERVAGNVDLRLLAGGATPDEALARRLEVSVSEAVMGMRAAGDFPHDVDPETTATDARRELLQLGPLETLLQDDDVSEIQVFRHDQILVTQARRTTTAEVGFSSEAALARIIQRLCVLGGEASAEGETLLERTLPRGAKLLAVLSPRTGGNSAFTVRKPQRVEHTLDELVRSGTISRGMAGLLAQCAAARANVLVVGARGTGAVTLLGALAAAGGTDDRLVALQDDDELVVQPPHAIAIPLGATAALVTRAVRSAARLRPDRVLVHGLSGHVAAEVVLAIGEGTSGVLAGCRAPTVRQAIPRLVADISAARPGIPVEAVHEWLASAFDLVVEIARLRDGRDRVLRVSDLVIERGHIAVRDVLTFSVERTAAGGAIEGSFHPSGVIPMIVEDLAARGITIDTAPLRRSR